ncbi:HNH endonuclease signature motif containing protein [Gordonia effusa]|nr:HNH endonuclease signature motif containing protein [Gordonia effusa]
MNDLLDVITTCRAGQSMLLWQQYRALAAMHDQLTPGTGDADARLIAEHNQVAARYAVTGSISQAAAMRQLNEALAMVYRLPLVGERLRDGVIAPWQFSRIVTRSDLIDGQGYRSEVDAEVANQLDRKGSWSARRLDALVDSAIFRHDPDAIRQRHHTANQHRNASVDPLADGMAELRVTTTAEDARVALAAINQLITHVCCPNDPRRRGAQRSDAIIARLNGLPFECDCTPTETGIACTGQPDTIELSHANVQIALHVITEQTTLADNDNDGMGYIDGHGIITSEHVRNIAARPDCHQTTMPPKPVQPQSNSGKPNLPMPCLPSNPYRFSTAFDTYIRARDLGCTMPGCDRSAWTTQLDHCREYNTNDPAAGGRTEAANIHALCVFHHLLKTGEHGWLDDMTADTNGHTHYQVRTPEGIWITGPTFTGTDIFETLSTIRFADPPPARANNATPRQQRTIDKHQRRQHEREQNRQAREAAEQAAPTIRSVGRQPHTETSDTDGDPPF